MGKKVHGEKRPFANFVFESAAKTIWRKIHFSKYDQQKACCWTFHRFCEKKRKTALIGNVEIDFSQSISGVTVYWVEQRAWQLLISRQLLELCSAVCRELYSCRVDFWFGSACTRAGVPVHALVVDLGAAAAE